MISTPSFAQWQVPSGNVPLGRGAGVVGFNSTTVANLLQSALTSICSSPVIGMGLYYTGTTWACIKSGTVTAQMFGAVCNGSTIDVDGPAIQAGINATPTTGWRLLVVGTCLFGIALDFKGKDNLTLTGPSGGNSIGINAQASLRWYGSGTQAMDFRNTHFDGVENLTFYNINSAFTGYLINAGGVTVPGDVSSGFTLRNVTIGSIDPSSVTGCLNIPEAILVVVDSVNFTRCAPAIHGQNFLGQNTVTKIFNSQFVNHVGTAIVECGETWDIANNAFEANSVGRAFSFQNSNTLPCRSIAIHNNWFGDTAASGGTHIQLTSTGAFIGANALQGETVNTNLLTLDGGSGYVVQGNYLNLATRFLSCVNNPAGGIIEGNNLTNITTPIPSYTTCLNFNYRHNSPDIAQSSVIVGISPGSCGAGANGTVVGNVGAGKITIGAAATVTCQVDFAAGVTIIPATECSITPGNAAAAAWATTVARVSSITGNNFVITGTALANAIYYYQCNVIG